MNRHRVKMSNTIATEVKMLEEMLQIQARVRARKEKERLIRTGQNEKYTKIFEPVTKTIEKLAAKNATHPAATVHQPKIKGDDEEPQSVDDDDDDGGIYDASLYDEVLNSIPLGNRDDGLLGLKVNRNKPYTGTIGDYNFVVVNDGYLIVFNDEIEFKYPISNPNLWRLLLVKSPRSMLLKRGDKYLGFVKEYKKIVTELDLVNKAYSEDRADYLERRKKIQLLRDMEKTGTGFLFSVQPPPSLLKKASTVVIPSDKKGLLRELYKAVAELRAGNTSMQNLVVPLAQEAKRKRILPKGLLSKKEQNWVFS